MPVLRTVAAKGGAAGDVDDPPAALLPEMAKFKATAGKFVNSFAA